MTRGDGGLQQRDIRHSLVVMHIRRWKRWYGKSEWLDDDEVGGSFKDEEEGAVIPIIDITKALNFWLIEILFIGSL